MLPFDLANSALNMGRALIRLICMYNYIDNHVFGHIKCRKRKIYRKRPKRFENYLGFSYG